MTHDHSHHSLHQDHSHTPRRYAGLTIDTHTHWYPQEWLDLVRKEGPAQGARIANIDHNGHPGYRFVNDKTTNAFSDEFVSIDLRLAGVKRQGVDAQALSLTTPMVYWARPGFGVALSECYNDVASRAHQKISEAICRPGTDPDAGPDTRPEGTGARGQAARREWPARSGA